MPIVNFYLNNPVSNETNFNMLIEEWAKEISVSKDEITLNIIINQAQYGKKYPLMANVFLPSIWGKDEIGFIQKSLSDLLVIHLNIDSNDIFIMTSVISSGHVFTKNQLETWE